VKQQAHPFLEIAVSLVVIVWAMLDWHSWVYGTPNGPLTSIPCLAIAPLVLADGVRRLLK
jgi:hypothetical protein